MRAIQITRPKKLAAIDIADPGKPAAGQALVRTVRMGICGTDVSSYLGKFPFFDYPRIPGHELGVEVVVTGEGVTNVAPGDHCSVEPYMNCGSCYPCLKGRVNCCEQLNVIGVMSDGGLCERFLVRAEKLHRSEKLSLEQLALVETLAIGCHAAARAAVSKGDRTLVIGTGPIGLSALEFLRADGAKTAVMDISKSRLAFCRATYGIEQILLAGCGDESELVASATGGQGFETVIDATGNYRSMSDALNYISHGGTLIYLGVTTGNITFPHPALHRRELTIKGARNALPNDFTRCIELIESGQIDTTPWITHRIGFDDVVDGFDALSKPESGVIKAMIEIS